MYGHTIFPKALVNRKKFVAKKGYHFESVLDFMIFNQKNKLSLKEDRGPHLVSVPDFLHFVTKK